MSVIPAGITPFRAGRLPGDPAAPAVASVVLPAAVAAGPLTLLADISEWNPDIADAAYLAWSKAIVIRCAYGGQHDDKAWYGGQRRDLLHTLGAEFVGIYQYLVAGEDGAAQARAFHRIVGAIEPGEVLIADFEEGARTVLTGWYNEMHLLYPPQVHPYIWTYTGLDFGAATGVLPVEWVAAYGQPEPATPHKLWQFTSTFPVPGVGHADCSLFHGSIDQLAALACQPAPPPTADWTYGPPRNLRVTPGRHNFHATWDPPVLGGPELPAYYMLWVYKGPVADRYSLVPTYPRTVQGQQTGPDPGGLEPGTDYILHVAASGLTGEHVKPGVYASAQFTTAHPLQ